jgi:hypothetical protein
MASVAATSETLGGVVAAGDTLGTGPSDPAEATLGIILRAVGLPSDLRAAQVALWLDSLEILDAVRDDLGEKFQTDIRNFILSPRFGAAVLKAKPDLANSAKELSGLLQSQFPEPPPVTVDLLETVARQALMLGRKEIPLTLVVLDEVQQPASTAMPAAGCLVTSSACMWRTGSSYHLSRRRNCHCSQAAHLRWMPARRHSSTTTSTTPTRWSKRQQMPMNWNALHGEVMSSVFSRI